MLMLQVAVAGEEGWVLLPRLLQLLPAPDSACTQDSGRGYHPHALMILGA